MQDKYRTHCALHAAIALVAFIATLGAPLAALAQDYPSKQVRIIIPFTAGGAGDTLVRLTASLLAKLWKQPVYVENRPGGNTVVGMTAAVNSEPDGYTLLFTGDQSITVNPLISSAAPYDVEKDLVPLSLIALNPLALAVSSDVPAKNVSEFIALARAKPDTILYGSSGPGSIQRMAMELFAQRTNIKLVHVPYRGANETVSGMLSGSVHASFNGISNFMQLVSAGRVRILAVAAGHRAKQIPDIPTVSEAGGPELKGYEALSWFGIFANAKVPKNIRDKIEADLALVLKMPEIEKTLHDRGFELVAGTGAEFKRVIDTDTAKWRDVITKGNITAQ
jgi:tripartite-type tricarboxylate transporter receptor subunit TctC